MVAGAVLLQQLGQLAGTRNPTLHRVGSKVPRVIIASYVNSNELMCACTCFHHRVPNTLSSNSSILFCPSSSLCSRTASDADPVPSSPKSSAVPLGDFT